MQALWSLAKAWFIGLGAFTTVIAAFVIATVLVVSGPPTASEANELQAASGDIFREIAQVGARACRRLPDGARRLVGCSGATQQAGARDAGEEATAITAKPPKPPPVLARVEEPPARAAPVRPAAARRATVERSDPARRNARASDTRRANATVARAQQAQRATARRPPARRAQASNSRRPVAAQPSRAASQRATPAAPQQRARPATQPAVAAAPVRAPVEETPRVVRSPPPETNRFEAPEDAADAPRDGAWQDNESATGDEDTANDEEVQASDDSYYAPAGDREWRPRRRRWRN